MVMYKCFLPMAYVGWLEFTVPIPIDILEQICLNRPTLAGTDDYLMCMSMC